MDIYVVNIIKQVFLIYVGNFFFNDFYNKTGWHAKAQYIQSDVNVAFVHTYLSCASFLFIASCVFKCN